MASIDRDVPSAWHDAFEARNDTSFNYLTNTIWMDSHTVSGFYFVGGFIFTNITIPKGATILDGSYVSFYAPAADEDNPNGTLAAEAVDSPNHFQVEQDVNQRWVTKRTSATKVWVVSDICGAAQCWMNTPELKDIIQEVIDRDGWVSGNGINIMFAANNNYFSRFRAVSRYISDTVMAKLHIEYLAEKYGPPIQVL